MSYDVVIFGIHLKLNPIAFTIPIAGGWDIYWYGIIIATGFVLALLYAYKNASRFNINIDRMLDVVLVTTPVAILCARAYYIIFDKDSSFKDFFSFSHSGFSGLAIYGGVIGAFTCGALMCYIRKVNILDMFDLACIGFLIGQGVGRWGNFVNQEAYGNFTGSSFFGMQSDRTIMECGEGLVHPCFLYESIWCIAGFFIINHLSKKRHFSGETVLMYGAYYGFGRFFIELLRTDWLPAGIGNLRISCLVSAVLVIFCSVALVVINSKLKAVKDTAEYVPVFEGKDEVTEDERDN